MSLAPLEKVHDQPQGGTDRAEAPTSFRERKLSQLQGEPEPTPGKSEDLHAESVEDGYPDDEPLDESPEALDDEDPADLDSEESEEELDDEPADEDEAEEDEEPEELTVEGLQEENLRLQQALSRVTENRKKIEEDFRDSIAENITFRHQLEDAVNQVKQQGAFWLQLANQQAAKYESRDFWATVPPEKMADAKQAALRARQQRDQLVARFQQMAQYTDQTRDDGKKREAELSRNILSRRIPDWGNELYAKLAEHSQTLHFTPEQFADITDWRVMELIHRDFQREQAVEKVQRIKRKKKGRVPRNRNGRQVPRSAEGRARKARDTAFQNPGDKSAFRAHKESQLAREGRRRSR